MHKITKSVRYAPDGISVREIAPGDYAELTDEQLAYARRAKALAEPSNKAVQSAPENKAKARGRSNA